MDCLSVCYEEKADQVRWSYQDSGVKLRSYFLGIIKFKAHRMCCGGLAGPWLPIWCMPHVCVAAVFSIVLLIKFDDFCCCLMPLPDPICCCNFTWKSMGDMLIVCLFIVASARSCGVVLSLFY